MGELSQQPMCPHSAQRRRCSHQPSPSPARHSAQPVPLGGTVGSSSAAATVSAARSVSGHAVEDRSPRPPSPASCPAQPTMSDAPAIEVRGLVKRFGDVRALDGLDLTAAHGSVLALLGPNGAGKTTLVRVLATLIKADAGSASVLGFDVQRDAARLREQIGLAGQYAAVDEN